MKPFFNPLSYCYVLCFFLLFAVNSTAQNSLKTDSIQPKNELKLDVFQLIVLPGIEITGGVGRLLTNEEKDGYYIDATAYPRISFAIGKQF